MLHPYHTYHSFKEANLEKIESPYLSEYNLGPITNMD